VDGATNSLLEPIVFYVGVSCLGVFERDLCCLVVPYLFGVVGLVHPSFSLAQDEAQPNKKNPAQKLIQQKFIFEGTILFFG